jgi:hypothetical protein
MERYLRINFLGPGPRLMKKEFTGPLAVSQRLRNTALELDKSLALYTEYGDILFPKCRLVFEMPGGPTKS